ncbi:MAG: NADH-quinone oxidoreductase subunit NuoN [Anaerolineales bacterium]|nr:NADH-quinone oxidoreductase subunit NuoN [Anaerolineales bacterium]
MSVNDFTTLLPFIIITGWACILLLVDLFVPRERKSITASLAALGLIVTLVVVVFLVGEEREAFDGMIILDGFSGYLQVLFIAAGLIAIAQAYDYLKQQGINRGEYYILLLFAVGGMILMTMAGDLIIVFLAIELLSIPLYILSGFARPQFSSEEAGLKYFLLGAFASSFIVYGIALVYGSVDVTLLRDIVAITEAGEANLGLLIGGAVFILIGLGFKVAVTPFHMWTPDVYQGAPSSVTSFMSVAAKTAGFAAIFRVFISAFPSLSGYMVPAIIVIAAITVIWGNVAALIQDNIKRMLAYSSIAHAGFILMALPAAQDPELASSAVSAALFYLVAYAVSNLGAWGVVLAVERTEGKGLEIDDYAGLGTRRPLLAIAMAVFMISLIGVPPTAGFMAKFSVFGVVLDAGLIWLAVVGVIASLISAYFYLRVIVVMYMKTGEPRIRSEGWLNSTVWLAAIGTILIGILPGPLLALAEHANLLTWFP